MRSNLKQYQINSFSADWFSRNIALWEKVLNPLKGKEMHVLEIGVFEGRSTIWILEELFLNPNSQLIVIDSFVMGSKQRFLNNIRMTGKQSQVKVITSNSREALLKMNAPKNKSFDFVYIDGAHDSQSVLNDAILSWSLLAPNGIMIFDDYDLKEVEFAVNALLNCYIQEIEIIHIGHLVALRRIKGGIYNGNIRKIQIESDIQTLNLSGNSIGDEGVKEIVKRYPILTSLDLSNNQIGPLGARIIARSLPKLQNLNLSNNYIGNKGAKEIGNLILLKNLNLCENQIGVEGVKAIAKNLKLLTTLNFHENKVGEIGAQYIGQNLLNLRNLNLCGNQIDNNGAISVLKKLPHLRILDLSRNQITSKGLAAMAQHLVKLVSLGLCANDIGDVELKYLLPYVTNFLSLDLSENNVQFSSTSYFSKNYELKELNLRENKIGDIGIKNIFQYFDKLENLNLSFNKITDKGIKAIKSKCLKLKLLDLHENKISFSGANKLYHMCPKASLDIRGNNLLQSKRLVDLQRKKPSGNFFYGNYL